MPRQYVNLDGDPAKPELSASLILKAKIDEKNPGDSKGGVGYFYVDPQGGVMALDMFPAQMRPQGFDKTPKYQIEASIEDKQMQEPVRIGSGGGDTYKFKYGKEADGSDAKSYPGDSLDVWRKIFLRSGHMKDCPALDIGGLTADFEPVFIEFEQDGGAIEIPREYYSDDIGAVISKMGPSTTSKHSKQTVQIGMVDRIGKRGSARITQEVWPVSSGGQPVDWVTKDTGKGFQVKLPDGNLTWPNDKTWIISAWAVFYGKSGTVDDLRFLSTPETFVRKDTTYRNYAHPEGKACRRVTIVLDELRKQINTMMSADTSKVVLEVDVGFIDSPYLGLASGSSPQLIVGTRDPLHGGRIRAGGIAKTVSHELGHIFGLVPRYLPVYSEDKAEEEEPEENGQWYFAMGGLGNHCGEGASDKQGTINGVPATVKSGGSCLMFHAGDESSPKPFCGNCRTLLRRADLTNLGLANVWPKGWKK